MRKIVLVASLILLISCQSEPVVDQEASLNATIDAALNATVEAAAVPTLVVPGAEPTLDPANLPTPVITIFGETSDDVPVLNTAPDVELTSLVDADIPTAFYYINDSDQLVLVSDGEQAVITSEANGVDVYVISPIDNSVGLITNSGELVQVDADGENRVLLATSLPNAEIEAVTWAANGRFLTFAQDGIKNIPNGGGRVRTTLDNGSGNAYAPLSWSADGEQLLISIDDNETNTIGVFADNTVTTIIDEAGNEAICCDTNFTSSGKSVYVSGDTAFRYNFTAEESINLMSDANNDDLIAAQQLGDGDVYGFFNGAEGYSFAVLRDDRFVAMRSDSVDAVTTVAWEPDAKGTVIESNGEIIWLARDDAPATLVGTGRAPQFGLGDPANKVEPLTITAQEIAPGDSLSGEVEAFGSADFVVDAEAGVGQLFIIETATETADITAAILDETGSDLIRTDVGYEWGAEVLYYIPEESGLLTVQIDALLGKPFEYNIRQIEFRYDADNVLIYEEGVYTGNRIPYFLNVEAGDKFFIIVETEGFADSILDVLDSRGDYLTFADENSENGPEALYYIAPATERLRIELAEFFLGSGSYIITVIDDNGDTADVEDSVDSEDSADSEDTEDADDSTDSEDTQDAGDNADSEDTQDAGDNAVTDDN